MTKKKAQNKKSCGENIRLSKSYKSTEINEIKLKNYINTKDDKRQSN
jgi:hypothetical protein